MKYKHQKDIKMMLFDEHRVESDPSVLNAAFNMRDELDEVYRKAHVFDKIVKAREKVGSEIGLSDYYEIEDFGRTVIDIVDRSD